MGSNVRIFVDDWRRPLTPDQILCTTYKQLENKINELLDKKENWLEELSLDYDLSQTDLEYDGADCLKLMIRTCLKYGLPMPRIIIHSSYPKVENKFDPIIYSYNIRVDEKDEVKLQYKPRN